MKLTKRHVKHIGVAICGIMLTSFITMELFYEESVRQGQVLTTSFAVAMVVHLLAWTVIAMIVAMREQRLVTLEMEYNAQEVPEPTPSRKEE